MQEFSLHASIAAQDLGPALAHLINLCSSPSKEYAEFVMNFGPKTMTRPVPHHYIRLVTELDPSIIPQVKHIKQEPVKEEVIEIDAKEDPDTKKEPSWTTTQNWAIQFQDTPDAAKRPTTARLVLAANVYHGDPMAFMAKINHEFHYEYVLKGHRLIHQDIIITLFQIFQPHTLHEIKDGIDPIDPSSGWILQAVVNVESNTEQSLVSKGLEELKDLKLDLSQNLGIDLEVVDRMLLDTRTRAAGQS